MLAKYSEDTQSDPNQYRLPTASSDSQFSQGSTIQSFQSGSQSTENVSSSEPTYSQSTESTITLSSPSQKYWCSSEGESMSQERLMPIHNEKVESASQTDQDIIVLGREEYQHLLLKATTIPFDMKSEVAKLSQKCYQLFGNSAQPEMNPDKMEKICHEADAINLFSSIYESMVTERQSSDRRKLNRSRTVVIIYMLLYGLSQKNNWFQIALARTLTEHGVSEHGLTSLKNLGIAAHPRTVKSASKASSDSHLESVVNFLNDAQNKRQLVVIFIDDYHNIHTMHRTSKQQQTQTIHMATLLLKVFPNVEANTDLTVTNLKKAITTHFGSMSFCDILAGEQDPSCKILEQIPDLKVIYFWFVDQGDSLDEDGKKQRKAGELPKQLRRFSHNNDKDFAFGPAKPTVPATSQFYPKSLSVLDMLKLGCPCAVVDERKAEVIQLYSFDLALMSWSVAPTSVQFILEKDPVGLSSFRTNQDGPLVLRVLLIFST